MTKIPDKYMSREYLYRTFYSKSGAPCISVAIESSASLQEWAMRLSPQEVERAELHGMSSLDSLASQIRRKRQLFAGRLKAPAEIERN